MFHVIRRPITTNFPDINNNDVRGILEQHGDNDVCISDWYRGCMLQEQMQLSGLLVFPYKTRCSDGAARGLGSPGTTKYLTIIIMSDNYETPKYAFEQIKKYIPKDKVIWEPFYLNAKSGIHLTDLGFKVIHENLDFFENDFGDIVVSNPPFSRKGAVIDRLVELKKPFMLLMPDTTLTTQCMRALRDELQIIVPPKRVQFIRDGIQTKNVSFGCLWYCWKMNLPRDLIFV